MSQFKLKTIVKKEYAFYFWLQEMANLDSKSIQGQSYWTKKLGGIEETEIKVLKDYKRFLTVYRKIIQLVTRGIK